MVNELENDLVDAKLVATNAINEEFYTKVEVDQKFQTKEDNKLNTIHKMIVDAINEVQARTATGWIEGQYVWMSTKVNTMPKGWKKVVFPKGYTLINAQSTETGLDVGKNKKINFWVTENPTAGTEIERTSSNRRFGYGAGTASGWSSSKAFLTPAKSVRYDKVGLQGALDVASTSATSSDADADANYAAGMYGALWQYDPNNIYSKTNIIEGE